MHSGVRCLLASLLLLFTANTALAQDKIWSGSGDGRSWDDPANWDPAGAPTPSDVVVISISPSDDYTVEMTGSVTVAELRLLTRRATLDVAGTLNVSGRYQQEGGVLAGDGTVHVGGLLTWQGGTMSGNGTLTARGGVQITGSAGSSSWRKTLDGRRLVIPAGTELRYLGTNTITGANGAEIIIEEGAVMDLAVRANMPGSGTIINNGTIQTSGSTGAFNTSWAVRNAGTIHAGNGLLELTGPLEDLDGRYEAAAGAELRFNKNGPVNFGAGSVIAGAGTIHFQYSGEYVIAGTYDVSGTTRITSNGTSQQGRVTLAESAGIQNLGRWLRLGGGSGRNEGAFESGGVLRIERPGAHTVDSLTIGSAGGFFGPVDVTVNEWFHLGVSGAAFDTEGALHVLGEALWQGGTFRGEGILRFDGGLSILGGSGSGSWSKLLDGRQMIVGSGASLVYAGTRALEGANGAEIVIEEGARMAVAIQEENRERLGILNVASGSTARPRLVNRGEIVYAGAQVATLRSDWDIVNEGSLVLHDDLTLQLRRGLTNEGTIAGSGRIEGDVTSAGLISPGGPDAFGGVEVKGVLHLLETNEIALEIGGASPGTNHDQLIAGTVELGGTLHLSLAGSFTPDPNDIYRVLEWPAEGRSGNFDAIVAQEGLATRMTATGVEVYDGSLPSAPERPTVSVTVDMPAVGRRGRAVPVKATIRTSGGSGITRIRAKGFQIGLPPPEVRCPVDDAYENLKCRMERFGVTPPEPGMDGETYPMLATVPFPGPLSGGAGSSGASGVGVFDDGASLNLSGSVACEDESIEVAVEAGRPVTNDDLAGCAYEIAKLALDFVPGYDCFKLGTGITTSIGEGFYSGQFDLPAYLAANMVGALNCAGDAVPATKAIKIMLTLNDLASKAGGLQGVAQACGMAGGEQAVTGRSSGRASCIASFDPNDKIGPFGAGDGRWLTLDDTLAYTVFFENLDEATAAAQIVIITDTLDVATVDFETFSFGMIAWGDTSISMPQGEKKVQKDVDLRPAHDLVLRIDAEVDEETGVLSWVFTSLDPQTMERTDDPWAGFLPPNKNSPEGEGLVSYTFRPVQTLASGTRFGRAARIIFDENDPIDTPAWFNGIDEAAPVSRMADLAVEQETTEFTVSWNGEDAESGVSSFDVFVSANGGAFERWIEATSDTSAVFEGEDGSSYAFYSVATDVVGHVEEKDAEAEVVTRVSVRVSAEEAPALPREFSLAEPFPNPFTATTTVGYALPSASDVRISVYDVLGRQVGQLVDESRPAGWHTVTFDARGLATGTYICKMEAGSFRQTRTIVIIR